MPIPTRQRKPGLAALALVLILGGAALSAYLVLHGSQKTSVVFATKQIAVGQPIQAGDLTEGEIAVTSNNNVNFRPVAYGNVGSLTRQFATTTIPAGAVITADMFGAKPTTSCVQAGFSVSEGNYPPGAIVPGDLVKIISVPKPNGNSDSSSGSGSSGGSGGTVTAKLVVAEAYVTAVKSSSVGQGGGAVFSVLVPNSGSGIAQGKDMSLAQASAAGALQVELLPKSTASTDFIKGCQ
jgi:hypothetical protein